MQSARHMRVVNVRVVRVENDVESECAWEDGATATGEAKAFGESSQMG